MAYPILAAHCTWFTQGGTTVKRASITQINIVDSYAPTGSEAASWDASASKNGSIMCYVTGTVLTLAGNGSGKISANADSKFAFSDNKAKDLFLNVTTINGLANLDMSGVVETNAMFYSCKALTSVAGIENWDMSNCTTLRQTFRQCDSLLEVNADSWNTSAVTSISGMFLSCYAIQRVGCRNWDLSNCTDMDTAFSNCYALSDIDVSLWDTSACAKMSGMFTACRTLKTLDVGKWDTSKVTTMRGMFKCGSDYGNEPTVYEELDVSRWDTSSCEDMAFMFYGAKGLGEVGNGNGVDLSRWDVSKVKDFDHFMAHSYMTIGDISGWKNAVVENLDNAFHSCRNAVLDVRGLKTSNCKTFGGMFKQYGSNLVSIPGVEDFDTSSAVDFTHMFYGCDKIEDLDLSGYDFRLAKDGVVTSGNDSTSATCMEMFYGMTRLKKISFGENFRRNGDGSTTNASHYVVLPGEGDWYDVDGIVDKTALPDGAGTYYASQAVANAEAAKPMLITQGTLLRTAKAIREKGGTMKQYSPSEFATAIQTI